MSFIHIKFNGWFQSRFATSHDPSDDPRGTRGFTRALPGEPDFDRIIRFHLEEGDFIRSHIKQVVGVTVKGVYDDTGCIIDHSLLEAKVSLEGNPIFKGNNGIIAVDGLEPIVPFRLNISNSCFKIARSNSLDPSKMPFADTSPFGYGTAPGRIAKATGIYNYKREMEERIKLLQSTPQSPVTIKRIELIRQSLERPGDRIFNTAQAYSIELKGPAIFDDRYQQMKQQGDTNKNWQVEFWMGGWDIDANCGFIEGYLSIPQL